MDILSIIDARLVAYVIIAGGITEGIMRATNEDVSRRRWAILSSFGFALVASFVDGLARGVPMLSCTFRGLLAAAIANSGYDVIKSLWVNLARGANG